MSHQFMLRKVLVVCLFGCLAPSVFSAIPGADNPKCYTEHEYRQQLLEFNHRTIVDAYQQVGHHDAKWDDAAKKFLQAMAIRNSEADAEGLYMLPDKLASWDELEAMGRTVINAGCDDPLVVDMFCLILHDQGKTEEMQPMLRKNVDLFLHSQYPVFRAASCLRRAVNSTDAQRETKQYNKFKQMLHDADLATMAFNKWEGPIDRRIVWSFMADDLERVGVEQQADFYQNSTANNADPWLLNMVGGKFHVNAAWKKRGNGVANTVTQLGWEGFSKELGDANECFQAAYKLQPTYPEAATTMITVAMGQNDAPGLRQWFDRAVQGQFDYEPAYKGYLYAIYPRWFGSHEMMYAFGKECADTKRFDTRVPRQFMVALDDISTEMGQDWSYWKMPGVFEQARDVLSGYADTSKDKYMKDFYFAEIAGWAWQLHRYDDARAALDKTDGTPNWDGMGEAGVLADRTTSSIYALTGPSKDELKKAEDANAAGNIDAAITAYDAMKDSIKPADRAAPWILGRAQELKWQKEFDGGDWVDLMPADSKMAGWWYKGDSCTSNGKKIIGTATSTWGTMALCGNRFGGRYELLCKVELAPVAEGEAIPQAADAGVVFGWHSSSNAYALRLSPLDHAATWIEPSAPVYRSTGMNFSATSPTIDVKIWDAMGDVLIDGNSWITNRPMYYTNDQEGRIGIAGSSPEPGAKFIISDLKIRKLTEQPPDIQMPQNNQ